VTTSAAELQELYRQEETSFRFLAQHKHDFNSCGANVGLIKDYFQEHRLEWTLENLEKAFLELKPKLAPVPGAVTAQPPAPEPPVPAGPVVRPPAAEPSSRVTIEQINSWDGPTMRKKMQNPVTRKEIDACLAVEQELWRLSQQQIQRQQMRENQ